MSRATELCKMLEKLMGKKNESATINSDDEELFDVEIKSKSLSEFLSELEALIPTLKFPPAQKVKPMVVSLAKFIEQVMAARQYYPLEDIECDLYIDSDIESYARFTFSGIGTFWCDDDEEDEVRGENFGQALEPFRSWDKFMGKYFTRHIVDRIDYDIYDKSFSFEVDGEIR